MGIQEVEVNGSAKRVQTRRVIKDSFRMEPLRFNEPEVKAHEIASV